MSEPPSSAVQLLALCKRYADTGDVDVLAEIERYGASSNPAELLKAFGPQVALDLRSQKLTLVQAQRQLATAVSLGSVVIEGDFIVGGNIANSRDNFYQSASAPTAKAGRSTHVLSLVLGGLAVCGVSIAGVWVKDPKAVAFVFGVVFAAGLLALIVAIPHPTPAQLVVFRTVLAICVAGAAAMVPGFLEVNIKASIKAGGALAVFVIVYFFNPPKLLPGEPPKPDTTLRGDGDDDH